MAITWDGAAWAATTAYAVNARVVNAGNVYQCASAGTSAGSGGPTGTTSTPITDGTATWLYLGASVGYVTGVVTFSASPVIAPGAQAIFLALAEKLVADPAIWIDELLDYGRLYLAGHFGQLFQMRSHGPVTAETVGALSRSYASLMGPLAIDLTVAGRTYMDLVRTTPAVMGIVA